MKQILILCTLLLGSFLSLAQTPAGDRTRLKETLEEEDYRQAIVLLDRIMQEADSSEIRNLSLEKARCLKKLYRTREAVEVLTGIMRPGDLTVLSELADCHFQDGSAEDALGCYTMLSMLRPDNPFFRLRKAALLFRLKDYEGTVEEATTLLQTDSIPRAAVLSGDALTELKRGEEALGMYERALGMNPGDMGVVTRIVRNKLGRKDYQGVLETVEPYLAENPDDMRLLPSKGLALYKLKEYKRSVDVFEHLKALGDTLSYGTRFFLGQDYSELNVIYRAKRELEAAWQIDSSDVELALAIASVNSRGHYSFREEVLPWYDKAHAMLQPDPVLSARVFQGYATGFFRQNDWAQAIVWYKKAYESNPAQKYFLSSIAYCYEQLKDYRTALSYYEEYLKAAKPGSSNYRFAEESVRYLKGELFMQEPSAPTP